MNYWLHPEAAEEHKKQVAYYEQIQPGLGRRYHTEFQDVVAWVFVSPDRSRIVLAPTSGVRCSKSFTLILFTVLSMVRFKSWPSPIIVASRVTGWLGFSSLPWSTPSRLGKQIQNSHTRHNQRHAQYAHRVNFLTMNKVSGDGDEHNAQA